jgi:hypothetical protein
VRAGLGRHQCTYRGGPSGSRFASARKIASR